jgi:hypothetical protein
MNIMERCLDYFKQALNNSSINHSLFSLFDRLNILKDVFCFCLIRFSFRRKRLQIIRKDMNTAKDLVSSLYQNLENVLINSYVRN